MTTFDDLGIAKEMQERCANFHNRKRCPNRAEFAIVFVPDATSTMCVAHAQLMAMRLWRGEEVVDNGYRVVAIVSKNLC